MTPRAYGYLVLAWVIAAVLAAGWALSRPSAEVDTGVEALQSLSPHRRAAASLETDDTLPAALASVAIDSVQGGWTGPGGHVFYVALRSRGSGAYLDRQVGRRVFHLGLRLRPEETTPASCSSCHEGQRILDGRGTAAGDAAHQDIQPVHPRQTAGQCRMCHAESDVARFALEGGETVSMDHAYRLCAQCHFQQVDSWANGAHGKRLVAWRGRRVVMTCADCHDPHRPATEPRPPMAGPSLPGELTPSEGSEGETEQEAPGGASHE